MFLLMIENCRSRVEVPISSTLILTPLNNLPFMKGKGISKHASITLNMIQIVFKLILFNIYVPYMSDVVLL